MKCLYIIILFFPFMAMSQEKKLEFKEVDWKKKSYSIAYLGNNLWNPGALFSMEIPWKFKNRSRIIQRKGSEFIRNRYRQWNFNGELGFVVDPRTSVGVFTSYGLQYRTIIFNQIAFNCKINPLGYYRSFLNDTYSVVDGKVEKVFLPGRSYYAPAISFGAGEHHVTPYMRGWYINLHIMIQAPYNAFINPLISINFGILLSSRKTKKS